MRNRSVPVETVLPHVVYRNVAEAIDWLVRVFGFREHYRYGEPSAPSGAQLAIGAAFVMVIASRAGRAAPIDSGSVTQMLTVVVDDVDAHLARTRTAGGKIIEDLQETIYGERQYGVEDLGGHQWLFSQHVRNISPVEWGATVAPE